MNKPRNRMFSKVSSKLVLLGGKVEGDGSLCPRRKNRLSAGSH